MFIYVWVAHAFGGTLATLTFSGAMLVLALGGVAAGVNFDQVTQTSAASGTQVTQTAWQASLSLALEGGVDIFRRDADRFGVYLRAESEVPLASYVALTLGLAYRQ